MKKCAIIVDSSFGIENNQYPDVYVCPLTIVINENGKVNSYHDNVEIFNKELCEKLANGLDVKTSQPTPAETLELFEKLSKEYEQVYALPITPTLSGSYNTWKNLSTEFKNIHVYSQTMVGRLAEWTVIDLVDANKKGLLTDQYIKDYLKKIESKRVAGLIVPDIEQLKKGGRISNFKSLLVKMFGLKLIITLDKEGLIFRNKSSSIEGAVKKMIDEANDLASFKNGKIKRCVFFTNEMNNKKFNIQEICDLVAPEFPNLKIEKTQLPAIITAHVGPNYFAIGLDIE